MTTLRSALDPHSAGYLANRDAMLAKLTEIEAEQAKAIGGGGPRKSPACPVSRPSFSRSATSRR